MSALEVIRRVSDPVGRLILRTLRRAVRGEEGFESLRLLRHFLDGSLGGAGGC